MALFRKLRGCALIGALSVFIFLLLLVGVEFALRALYRGSSIDPNSSTEWAGPDPAKKIVLLDPQPFITNADGLYVANPIEPRTNIDGFRTPDFDEPAEGRKSILFVGDSFTWGIAAQPIGQCFVDRVREAGYRTINLGISGTGPTQYLAEAERYVPQLKPDAVCVMFCAWNDFLVEAPIRPGLNRAFMTNTGILFAAQPDGTELTFEEALARQRNTIPFWVTPTTQPFLARTALGRYAAFLGNRASRWGQDEAQAIEKLRRIRDIATANGAPFFLFLLPVRPAYHSDDRTPEALAQRFGELDLLAPGDFGEADFEPLPDIHFNNTGHEKMAKFILPKLAEAGFPPHAVSPAWPADPLPARPTFAAFADWLSLDTEQRTGVTVLLNRLKDDSVDLLFRRPAQGDTSPGIQLRRLRRQDPAAGLDSPPVREVLLKSTPDPKYTSYAEILDGLQVTVYRQIAAKLPHEALHRFKVLAPERLLAIDTGYDPLEQLLKR